MKDFKDVEFLFYEQDKNKDIAKTLGINYWTTIVVLKVKMKLEEKLV